MMKVETFDDVLKFAGTHGKWQWIVFFIASLSGFFVAFHNMGAVFLAATPEHWCSSTEMEKLRDDYNWTEQELKVAFIPLEERNGILSYSSCKKYVLRPSDFEESEWLDPGFIYNYTKTNDDILPTEECTSWTYDNTSYTSTVISEWDLVCSRKALSSTVQGSFMSGVLLGCIIFGWVSDRFGRRKAVLIATVQFVVAANLTVTSRYYIMFLVLRFIGALGDAGVFSVAFVIVTEISGKKSRALLGIQYMVPFAIGFMALPGIAYFVRDWFWLQMSISVPCILLLGYFWVLPESPRWLLTQGRLRDTLNVLKAGAKANGRTLPCDDEMFAMLQATRRTEDKQAMETQEEEKKSGNFLDLIRTPKMRKRSLVVGLSWFVAGMVYYGLSFSAPFLGTSIYIYVFLAAAVELPAFAGVYLLIQRMGRKIVFITTIILSAVSCLLILVAPSDLLWLLTTLALTGKLFCTANFVLCFLYTVELFPTTVRNLAVGTGAMLSRLGSVVAPYIIDLLGQYHESIPMATFGTMCLLSGILAFNLPETMHGNLPESVQEIEDGEKKPQKEEAQIIKMTNFSNNSTA